MYFLLLYIYVKTVVTLHIQIIMNRGSDFIDPWGKTRNEPKVVPLQHLTDVHINASDMHDNSRLHYADTGDKISTFTFGT